MAWQSTGIAVSELTDGVLRESTVGETVVLLLRWQGRVVALRGRCPHEGGVLAEGRLESDRIVCPIHGATFHLPDGKIVADPDGITPPSGEVPSLETYPVREEHGQIAVQLP